MKIPISWLKEYVDLPQDHDAKKIAEIFTSLGFEVEALSVVGEDLKGPIKIGQIAEIEEITGYKKPIRFCQVDVGKSNGGIRGIVCGAQNFKIGDKVVVALPGSVLSGDFQISQRNTYERLSDGMICSQSELGLSDDHTGILVVDEKFEVGQDAVSALHLKDIIFDLSILPDRGYAMSVRGLARELSAKLKLDFRDPAAIKSIDNVITSTGVSGEIVASEHCSSLVLTTIEGYDSYLPIPWDIRRKLIFCGMRSISLAVDVTNYVMLLTGQPLHAFDASKVDGGIRVRLAKSGENLVTLDHVNRSLDKNDLLIADSAKPLSLAGVMGGLSSEISETSTQLVIEAASFSSSKIAEVSRRHTLSSEACKRFERGVDPLLPQIASDLAVQLLAEFSDTTVTGRSVKSSEIENRRIEVNLVQISQIAGFEFDNKEALSILKRLGCQVISEDSNLVQIPSWRPDLETNNDIAEELLRIKGYEEIPIGKPSSGLGTGHSKKNLLINKVRAYLASTKHVEILNYPFVDEQIKDIFSIDVQLVKLANPLSNEVPYLRPFLISGLATAAIRNFGRGTNGVALFEIGTVFEQQQSTAKSLPNFDFPTNKQTITKIDKLLPTQSLHLGIFLAGIKRNQSPLQTEALWDWRHSVEIISEILTLLNVNFKVESGNIPGWHPGRCAVFSANGIYLGHAGELHPKVLESLSLPNRCCAAELNLDLIVELSRVLVKAELISNMPVAKEDIAVVVSADIPVMSLIGAIAALENPEIESAEIFDVYIGDQVPVGSKSVAIALRFRPQKGTFEAEGIAALKQQVLDALASSFGAKLRN